MRRGQPPPDGRRNLHGLAYGQRALREPRVQRLAVEQLGDDVELIVVGTDVVQREDVGVGERRHGVRLALEAEPPVGVIRHRRGKHLDGNVTVKARVACPIHLAHATGPERREDLVGTEPYTAGERHERSHHSPSSPG